MMKQKRLLALVLAAALLLCGCARQEQPRKYTVICAVFPAWDWVREIVGSCPDVELILLSDKGVDLHSYQATARDMVRINSCDLFVYVGGESDAWVDAVLEAVPNPDRAECSLLSALEGYLYEEETIEGMQQRGLEAEEEAPEYDEHVWLSLCNAQVLCAALTEALCAMAPEYADTFRSNSDAYTGELARMDAEFSQMVRGKDVLMFCDRFPFRYLVEDYGLRYYAAFSGCSGDSEASFATVLFLAQRAEEEQLHTLLQLEDSDGKLARSVAGIMADTPQILTLNSMQSVSLAQARAGQTYLTLMQQNLNALSLALEQE